MPVSNSRGARLSARRPRKTGGRSGRGVCASTSDPCGRSPRSAPTGDGRRHEQLWPGELGDLAVHALHVYLQLLHRQQVADVGEEPSSASTSPCPCSRCHARRCVPEARLVAERTDEPQLRPERLPHNPVTNYSSNWWTSQIVPSGGAETVAENGCACHGLSIASTSPELPTPEPP